MNITIYKYTEEIYLGSIVKYFAIWHQRTYAYVVRDVVLSLPPFAPPTNWKEWRQMEGVDRDRVMNYVRDYPDNYHEVSALEALVVCGKGPWDE